MHKLILLMLLSLVSTVPAFASESHLDTDAFLYTRANDGHLYPKGRFPTVEQCLEAMQKRAAQWELMGREPEYNICRGTVGGHRYQAY